MPLPGFIIIAFFFQIRDGFCINNIFCIGSRWQKQNNDFRIRIVIFPAPQNRGGMLRDQIDFLVKLHPRTLKPIFANVTCTLSAKGS